MISFLFVCVYISPLFHFLMFPTLPLSIFLYHNSSPFLSSSSSPYVCMLHSRGLALLVSRSIYVPFPLLSLFLNRTFSEEYSGSMYISILYSISLCFLPLSFLSFLHYKFFSPLLFRLSSLSVCTLPTHGFALLVSRTVYVSPLFHLSMNSSLFCSILRILSPSLWFSSLSLSYLFLSLARPTLGLAH